MAEAYLVVWTTRADGLFDDTWETCETLQEAVDLYNELRADETTYSCSVCKPILSTDYILVKEQT